MSRLIGTFANEHDLVAATRAARLRGMGVVDAFTPYPVHGLDEAMGLRRTRLGIICFVCGLVGVVAAMAFQHWTLAIDWPINVGGRPFNSWPAFVPVGFEVLVLFAGFGVVFAFLGVSRLFPGMTADAVGPRATNDQFVLVVEAKDASADAEVVRGLLRDHHAIDVRDCDAYVPTGVSSSAAAKDAVWRPLNIVLICLLAVGALLNWTLGSDHERPNREFLPEMVHAVSAESFGRYEGLPRNMVLQPPPHGSIARGHLPTPLDASLKDAEQLVSLYKADDARARKRGSQVFGNYCAACHGTTGSGDGPVSQRGMPPPPPLMGQKAKDLKDGQIFHIITYGQGNMPPHAGQIPREDRWAVILHVGQLQNQKRGRP